MTKSQSPEIGFVLFCGLPGVGKTDLATKLNSFINSHPQTSQHFTSFLFSYDSLLSKSVENAVISSNEWKAGRSFVKALLKSFAEHLKQQMEINDFFDYSQTSQDADGFKSSIEQNFLTLLKSTIKSKTKTSSKIFLLIDDNFYYESMRYEYFKLACECDISYVCFCLQTASLPFLLERNSTRSEESRLNTNIIQRMFEKFEPPNLKDGWECKFSHNFQVDERNSNPVSVQELLYFILDACSKLAQYLADKTADDAQKTENLRLGHESAKNPLHECDLILRKIVKTQLNELKRSTADISMLSKKLLEVKLKIIGQLKSPESSLAVELASLGNNDLTRIEQILTSEFIRVYSAAF